MSGIIGITNQSGFTRDDWAAAFLAALGNSAPQRAIQDWVVAWTNHETCTNCEQDCSFNLLNTHVDGWPKCGGDAGLVSAFPDLQTGAAQNAAVLRQAQPGYSIIADALASNTLAPLINGDAWVGLHTWEKGPNGTTLNIYAPLAPGFPLEGAVHRLDRFTYGSAGTGGGGTAPYAGQQCVECGPAKALCCAPRTCQNGLCVDPITAAPGNAAGAVVNAILPGWLQNPDWARFLKFVLGLALIGLGLLLLFAILTDKAESNPAVQAATKLAAVGA